MTLSDAEPGGGAGEGRRRRASGGAEARRARRQAGGRVQLPFIRRKLKNYEVLDEEGLSLIEANTDLIMEEIGIEFREDEEALAMWREAGADVKGSARAFSARALPLARQDRAEDLHAACAQSRARGRDRRQRDRLRAGLRPALRARPRQGPPLRHDRGFSQLREARLHGAGDPPFRRHRVRAGRRARQQAAPRHGLFAHPLFRQTLHGLRHASGARGGFRRRWRRWSSARSSSPRIA